jgi:hypothetical protein
MSQIRRRRLFVDAKLQGALLSHVALYWAYCLLSVGFIAVVWIVFAKRPPSSAKLFEELWMNCGPALLGSILLLPLVLLDCLRLSNRFAGPMVRLNKAIKDLADGETARPVKVREDDFWCEFAQCVNRLIEQQANCKSGNQAAQRTDEKTEAVSEMIEQPTIERNATPPLTTSIYSDITA